LWCVQVYPTKSALHPQVEERYNSSVSGTSRLTFAYRPVSWSPEEWKLEASTKQACRQMSND